MGVTTEQDIDYGQIFGPFPDVGTVQQSHFIGLLTSDDRDEGAHNIKINVVKIGLDVTWLPYILPARTEEEQNMEAYVKEGRIYYRTLRIIRAREELLVWYSKDFTQILNIPTVKRKDTEDSDQKFTCQYCGQRFKYMFPVMAHMKFRCPENSKLSPSNFSLHKDQLCKDMSLDLSPVQKCILLEEMRSCKRTADTMDAAIPAKRSCFGKDGENESNAREDIAKQQAGNSGNCPEMAENWSAFRKVEKGHLREIDRNTGTVSVSPVDRNEQLVTKEQQELRQRLGVSQALPHDIYAKRLMSVNPFDNRLAGGFGMLLSANWMSAGGISGSNPYAFANRTPVSGLNKLPVPESGNSNLRNMDSANELSKRLLLEELRKSQFPYMKTANPMVEKYLHTASPVMVHTPIQTQKLADNWCAKCNASFRMTSDLVYHMRSHHKREFDPMKRKREEKLQCAVCHETFKERHHLTRHMTSHT